MWLVPGPAGARGHPEPEWAPPPPPQPSDFVEHVGRDLDLDAAVMEKIRALAREADERSRDVEQRLGKAFDELRRLMAEERPDRARVLAQVELVGSIETEKRKIMTGLLLSVRELLSPEQRTQLQKIMEQKRRRGPPPDGPRPPPPAGCPERPHGPPRGFP